MIKIHNKKRMPVILNPESEQKRLLGNEINGFIKPEIESMAIAN